MSFVTQFFIKPVKPRLLRLPTGSFTVNSDGTIMGSTMPQAIPMGELRRVAGHVLSAFRAAESANIPLAEICFQFQKMKVQARGTRKGAIIFFQPE
jgi:hypothetical protein